jgi:uncharacterized protein (DUF302 family)
MTMVQQRQIGIERVSVTSFETFETVVARIDREVGRPEIGAFFKKIADARTLAELQAIVQAAVGPSGLIEFARFDHGEILRKEQGANARQSLRLLLGNPLIMKEMAKHVPDAGSYAPVTILITETTDAARLSYDRMASVLAPYRNAEALKVTRDLDARIEALLMKAACGCSI